MELPAGQNWIQESDVLFRRMEGVGASQMIKQGS
jgi:hypothetical protein